MSRDLRFRDLLELVSRENPFQRARLAGLEVDGLDDLARVPFTTKEDLVADQASRPPFGSNLTFPLAEYSHLHHTSGTTGATLRVLDTSDDWTWWRERVGGILAAAGLSAGDRVALAYSFGPYVQFWASYAGVEQVGAMAIAMGGMDSVQRLHTISEYSATALLCTPSYALHLANIATRHGLTDALGSVERIVCAGEPGASVPAVRQMIEDAWGARCFDHAGLSEVGAFGRPCPTDGGIHLDDSEFVCEILCPDSAERVSDGEVGELVITALGRRGFPAIRYRTGDVVVAGTERCSAQHPGRWLPKGILGRTDDMVVIRGMNVFPSAIEQTLRESSEVGEFRITFYTDPRAMDEVKVEVELARASEARAIQARMRERLGLRVRIVPLQAGILPPSDGKARRVEDLRTVRREGVALEA